jgi:hypothetical protein
VSLFRHGSDEERQRRAEAHARNAEGVVGIDIEVKHHCAGGSYIIEFYARGTAIIKEKESGEPPTPLTVIDLRL